MSVSSTSLWMDLRRMERDEHFSDERSAGESTAGETHLLP
jgi:hypothetical protein